MKTSHNVLQIFICCVVAFWFILPAMSQEPKVNQDSIRYQAIEKFSQKTKLSRSIHRLTFRPLNSDTNEQGEIIAKSYMELEGKIVRDIHIVTLDPFGYNIEDTTIHPRGFLKQAGNSLHIKTRKRIIENLLLCKRNDPFDSLKVKESERLIRLQKYVRDVLVNTVQTSSNSDSVDIYIRVSDVWSIVPAYRQSSSEINIGITDNNVMGRGHAFHVSNEKDRLSSGYVREFSYLVPNIGSSYISSKLEYSFSDSIDLVKSIEFERTFFSPLTKWGGGLFLGQTITEQTYVINNLVHLFSSPTNMLDLWGARSWQLFKGNSANARTTNIILSGRFSMTRYPGTFTDDLPSNIISKTNFYFTGVGITSRKYVQDKYIFKYGIVEDVPVGRYFGITLGREIRQTHRSYFGAKAAWGNYYSFGYLSSHLEYGTFKDKTGFHQQVVTGHINYFTHLMKLGNWKIRQFVKPSFVFGINRLPTDNLSFSEELKEFNGEAKSATHMMALTLQTQSYAPWDLFGFRFGPYFFSSFGLLGNKSSGFSKSRLYSYFGLGMLIKNDYLMFKTFQISLVFYPFLPEQQHNIFKANAYKTDDFGFRDFEIGKPGVVVYK